MNEIFTPEQEARIVALIRAELTAMTALGGTAFTNNILTCDNVLPLIPGLLERIAARLSAASRFKDQL